MAFFLLFIGVILLLAAYKNKQDDLATLLKDDFTGSGNFFQWVLAIMLLVALGAYKPIRPVTDAFLGLIILVIILVPYRNNRDLVNEFIGQIREGTN